ncbi:MAG: hypothetical protein DRQ59_04550 [Gammaproteobacteria bacterium]|nr:MAG: hypothetical protein DRQ59_04550 [Gammaproteobacteria bacterium]
MANQGLPLAAEYYTDEKFFHLDRHNIFFRSWQCVCHQSEVANRWFSDGSLPDVEVEALMHIHKTTTGAEDEIVVSKIQTGMESRAFGPGPYILGDGIGALSEVGVKHFHELYRTASAISQEVGIDGD